MSENNSKDNEKNLKRFEIAFACRNSEIDLYWRRFSYHWIIVAASLLAYGSIGQTNSNLGIMFACFGLITSTAWLLVNIGSKWWQVNWEKKLEAATIELLGDNLFKPEIEIRSMDRIVPIYRFSVSRIATILSGFTAFLWLAIFFWEVLSQFTIPESNSCFYKFISFLENKGALIVAIVTFCFVVIMVFFCKGSDAKSNHTPPRANQTEHSTE